MAAREVVLLNFKEGDTHAVTLADGADADSVGTSAAVLSVDSEGVHNMLTTPYVLYIPRVIGGLCDLRS